MWTRDGLKPIETIQIGEVVHSWDEKTGSFVEKKVTEQFVHEVPQLFDLELDGEEVIHTTWNHPFWVVGKKAWVKVMDLQVGDLVLLHDGSTVPVTGVHYYNIETTKVYNIEVEDTHAYLVGEHGVVVHNYAQDVGGIVGAVRSAVEELKSGLSDKESLQHDPEYVGKVTETIKRLSAYESESRHLDAERNDLQKEQNKAKLKVDLAKNNNNIFLRAIRSSEADHIPGIKEIRNALKGSNGGEGFNKEQMQAIDKFVNGGLTNDALVRSGFRQGQVGFQEGFSGNRIAQERWKGFVLESAYNVKGSGEVAGAQRAISETSARIEERSQKISANESAVSKEIARSKEEMQTYLAGSKTAIESPEGRNRHVEDPKVKDGVSVAAKEPRENDPEQDRKNDAKERTKQNVEAAGYEATKHKEEEEERVGDTAEITNGSLFPSLQNKSSKTNDHGDGKPVGQLSVKYADKNNKGGLVELREKSPDAKQILHPTEISVLNKANEVKYKDTSFQRNSKGMLENGNGTKIAFKDNGLIEIKHSNGDVDAYDGKGNKVDAALLKKNRYDVDKALIEKRTDGKVTEVNTPKGKVKYTTIDSSGGNFVKIIAERDGKTETMIYQEKDPNGSDPDKRFELTKPQEPNEKLLISETGTSAPFKGETIYVNDVQHGGAGTDTYPADHIERFISYLKGEDGGRSVLLHENEHTGTDLSGGKTAQNRDLVAVETMTFEGIDANRLKFTSEDGNLEIYYHHTSGIAVGLMRGDVLNPGDYTGRMGTNGHSENPHLHLAVYDKVAKRWLTTQEVQKRYFNAKDLVVIDTTRDKRLGENYESENKERLKDARIRLSEQKAIVEREKLKQEQQKESEKIQQKQIEELEKLQKDIFSDKNWKRK
ncbi:polymorphic toxin-type HINT domain-containing protein [Leptospira semungkisensis]|uniref:polymorphic toxin-type HINT domain-containing protein n=1 Tax=Leptospira semungkisensis TaxID=2484985 RepID=UPI001FE82B4C|nr:polymorphic toxin-type HINT domain-containing protein [Leptospira semungkisensis]